MPIELATAIRLPSGAYARSVGTPIPKRCSGTIDLTFADERKAGMGDAAIGEAVGVTGDGWVGITDPGAHAVSQRSRSKVMKLCPRKMPLISMLTCLM